jgi:hypothetical protein
MVEPFIEKTQDVVFSVLSGARAGNAAEESPAPGLMSRFFWLEFARMFD